MDDEDNDYDLEDGYALPTVKQVDQTSPVMCPDMVTRHGALASQKPSSKAVSTKNTSSRIHLVDFQRSDLVHLLERSPLGSRVSDVI